MVRYERALSFLRLIAETQEANYSWRGLSFLLLLGRLTTHPAGFVLSCGPPPVIQSFS